MQKGALKMNNILIACEESQTVLKYFYENNYNVFSCDLTNFSGHYPERHILADVRTIINGDAVFTTLDKKSHYIDKWDMIIAFPPCTYFTHASGNRMFYFDKDGIKRLYQDRYNTMLEFRQLFLDIYYAKCDKICIENPSPMKICKLPLYSQVIQPYEFGHPYIKQTCLWLKGLPELKPTNIITDNLKGYVRNCKKSAIERSKTFDGVASAMYEQFTQPGYFEEQLKFF